VPQITSDVSPGLYSRPLNLYHRKYTVPYRLDDPMSTSRLTRSVASRARRLQQIAASTFMALGGGHLLLAFALEADVVRGWLGDGLWATVPLLARRTVEGLENGLAFWAGLGSFAVPLLVAGGLLWWLADRDLIAPTWVGWVLCGWFTLGTVLLVPSPMPVGLAAAIALILASRSRDVRL